MTYDPNVDDGEAMYPDPDAPGAFFGPDVGATRAGHGHTPLEPRARRRAPGPDPAATTIEDYTPADAGRLTGQLSRVFRIMESGEWYTLAELVDRIELGWGVRASEAGVSARIRDLRKPEHGGYTVERQIRPGSGSVREYRLILASEKGSDT